MKNNSATLAFFYYLLLPSKMGEGWDEGTLMGILPSPQPSPTFRGRGSQTLCITLALLILNATLAPRTARASSISSNAGTTNDAFLKIATDARGVALTDTMVALADGTDASRWNPAGLSTLQTKEASFTDVQYYQGVTMQNAGIFFPFEDSGLAANVFYLSPGSLDGRSVTGAETGDFQFYDLVGSLGYGRKIMTREEGADISVGGNIKIVEEKIDNESFQDPALDLGARVVPWDDTSFGISVRDLSTSSANFPREIVGGGAYTWFHVFTTGAAINYANDAPVRLSASGEYNIPELDSVIRAGYRSHDELDDSTDSQIPALRGAGVAGLTMGAGINYKPPIWPTTKFLLDYAMAPFGALGISHTITLKMQW